MRQILSIVIFQHNHVKNNIFKKTICITNNLKLLYKISPLLLLLYYRKKPADFNRFQCVEDYLFDFSPAFL